MSGKSLQQQIVELNNRKIDKSASQGLSEENFTTVLKDKLDDIEAQADVTDAVNIAESISGVAEKPNPVDTDDFPLLDSENSNFLKKITWSNIKARLKEYFDGLYVGQSVGTWTTTLTLVNCSSATPSEAYYVKVGRFCHCSLRVSATLTTTGLETRITFTLPFNTRDVVVRDASIVYHNLSTDVNKRGIGITVDATGANFNQAVAILPASTVQQSNGSPFVADINYTYVTE